MRTKTTKILWLLVSLFLVVTVISQIYIYLYEPLKTEVAMLYNTTSSLSFKAVFVRNERQISYTGDGVVCYTHPDGSKLAKNSAIAKIYKCQNDVAVQQQIDEIEEQITVLEDAQSLSGTDNSQLEALSNQIYEKHTQLLQYIESGDYTAADDLKNQILNLQSKRQIAKGNAVTFQSKIDELTDKITVLKAQISAEPDDLKIDETGYFASIVDGYESQLNYDNIENLTAEKINNIIKNPVAEVDSRVIGKIIDGYEWKFVTVLDSDKALTFFEGSNYKLRVGNSSSIITTTVESVKKNDDGTSILIFKSDRFTSDLAGCRVSQFNLLLDDYSGIRISSQALRFDKDNNPGVYIKSGVQILFKKVKVVVSEADYVIVENTVGNDGYLSLYDNVIVEGKDLYDGKVTGY